MTIIYTILHVDVFTGMNSVYLLLFMMILLVELYSKINETTDIIVKGFIRSRQMKVKISRIPASFRNRKRLRFLLTQITILLSLVKIQKVVLQVHSLYLCL